MTTSLRDVRRDVIRLVNDDHHAEALRITAFFAALPELIGPGVAGQENEGILIAQR